MPTALLAFLLLAATVDPRLAEPLRLLAEVRDRAGVAVGAEYAERAASRFVSIEVAQVRGDGVASYDIHHRTVTVAETVLDEDLRIVATVLAHELRHSIDRDLIAFRMLDADCLEYEARGFEAHAVVMRALNPDGLPGGTRVERAMSATVRLYERGGSEALRAWLAESAAYQEQCADWRA